MSDELTVEQRSMMLRASADGAEAFAVDQDDMDYAANMRWCADALESTKQRAEQLQRTLDGVGIVYDHITGGRISKPATNTADVMQVADERVTELVEDETKQLQGERDEAVADNVSMWAAMSIIITDAMEHGGRCKVKTLRDAANVLDSSHPSDALPHCAASTRRQGASDG